MTPAPACGLWFAHSGSGSTTPTHKAVAGYGASHHVAAAAATQAAAQGRAGLLGPAAADFAVGLLHKINSRRVRAAAAAVEAEEASPHDAAATATATVTKEADMTKAAATTDKESSAATTAAMKGLPVFLAARPRVASPSKKQQKQEPCAALRLAGRPVWRPVCVIK